MTITNRYVITLIATFIRSGLGFVVSIAVARFLLPESYGDYQYLFAVATSMLLLANLGTDKAYFTFISQKKQNIRFHILYFSWLAIQLLLCLLFVFLISQNVYHKIFQGFSNELVLMSIVSIFFLGNVQNTISSIAESVRKTQITQSLNISVAIIHFLLIFYFININTLDIEILFAVLIFEFSIYSAIFIFIYYRFKLVIFSDEEFNISKTCGKFYKYSKPLILYLMVAFVYRIIDRWLIQEYIGSTGQAYFSISLQFSALVILLTTSILKIYWKEVSESVKNNNREKTKRIYILVSDNLFFVSTLVSSVLFFFSDSIINYFYSDEYAEASLVFKLIMLYPIVQSTGQLQSVFLLGSEKVKLYRNVSIIFLIFGVFLAIFLISDLGLKLGVESIAAKMLMVDLLSIIVLEYYINKSLKIESRYAYKAKYLLLIFTMSFSVYYLQSSLDFTFIIQVLLVSIFYVFPVAFFLLNRLKKGLTYDL
jgi:O-antigen/teichoic acid export membrane protein